jgi:hypothetical protein
MCGALADSCACGAAHFKDLKEAVYISPYRDRKQCRV